MTLNTISMTELRRNSRWFDEALNADRPVFITVRNQTKGVFLPLELYNELLEEIQDIRDLQILQEVEAEGGDFQPYDEFRRELIAEGLLEPDDGV